MTVVLYSGTATNESRVKSVSTSFPINSFVQSSFGELIPATSGSTSIAGVTCQSVDSSSSDYALNGAKMSIIIPDDDTVFLIDYVNGTPLPGTAYDLFNADTINVAATSNKIAVCVEVKNSTQALFKIKARETVGGGAGGAASTLQASYTAGSQILYDGSHPVTVRSAGTTFSGASNALFAADAVGATPFAIGFSALKDSTGFGAGLPAFASAWSLVPDTNVTFPSATSIDFGAGVNLVTAGVTTNATVQVKTSNVAADEAIYQILSITNGAGTNSKANLGINYKTFAPANITSTTGVAIVTQQGEGMGGSAAHFLTNIYSFMNSNPATGTGFAINNYGGLIGGGFVGTNNSGTLSNVFYFQNSSAASFHQGLTIDNAPGGIRTGVMAILTDSEATSTQDVLEISNAGTGKDIKTTNAEIRKDGGIQCSYVRAILPTGDAHNCVDVQITDVAAASNAVNISNSGTGFDIAGTAGWNITKAGNITGVTLNLSGILEFADNAAALLGGLVIGDLYRTADVLKIVH